jgi:hypothetical protein
MSLSMVFGTPTIGMPRLWKSCAMLSVPVTADHDQRVESHLVEVLDDAV